MKPEIEKMNPDEKGEPSRRSFLKLVWGGLGFVALAELLWVGLSFFKPGKRSERDAVPSLVDAGAVGDFLPGSVTPNRAGASYIARLENGGFLAMSSRCTHLGCAVTWDPAAGRFECPCHASAFDIRGEVLRPPAPRPLDYYTVQVEKGRVMVQTQRKMKRSRFSFSQVTGL